MKGIIRIGGALVFSIAVIAGTFFYTQRNTPAAVSSADSTVIVVAQNTRPYISLEDENENGISDWEESFERISVESLFGISSTSEYTAPDTISGKFSQIFFAEFMQAYANDNLDGIGKQELIDDMISSLETGERRDRYTTNDIIVGENTDAALREYGNTIAAITYIYSPSAPSDDELSILQRALTQNDESILDELMPLQEAYENYIRETLLVPVPPEFVGEHVELLNIYQAVSDDMAAFRIVFSDPLYTLTQIEQYISDASELGVLYVQIYAQLFDWGMRYSETEPASLLIQGMGITFSEQ